MIYFHIEDIDYKLSEKKSTKNWITNCIENEGYKLGDINYILCSDDYLLQINTQYLNHDTYTDIVTFNYCTANIISGDLFISVERVKENSELHKATFETELKRVMIHGVLHLMKYNDKTSEEVLEMRAKEDFYLTLLA